MEWLRSEGERGVAGEKATSSGHSARNAVIGFTGPPGGAGR